jgi:hypothetical protein
VAERLRATGRPIRLDPALNSPNALRNILRDWIDEPGDTN